MSLVELLTKLISFKSITPNDDGCLEFITKVLLNMGFKCKKLNFGNSSKQTKNIYAHFSRGPGTHFCFAGHVDVVPPGDNWKSVRKSSPRVSWMGTGVRFVAPGRV